ncbi:DUF5683 domain-containing protein [Polaribacter butkevichii]|uniref:DUF5683 domain-containing protein n=1 Tax=Polaribacter butkevichii TaxID=218490 RepID=A0A2P6C9I6_9FLAO|nr:DUF5683 domain-containing protein [Polaribacter butkevichii]PQJ69582.1 hypothetical protein BTO14_16410 [Polaribacter butkevichii]
MLSKKYILIIFLAFFSATIFGQKDSLNVKGVKVKGDIKIEKGGVYDAVAPSKAAFYSAIFPGMGQVYNKKYWKAPIVWGAMGTSIYYYLDNNKEYKRYRTAYKLRKNNLVDEFTVDGKEVISLETLERAQDQLRENRDMSLLTTVILYVLQIVEASVNAHLLQFNTDDNLSFKPTFLNDPIYVEAPKVGLTIKYNF